MKMNQTLLKIIIIACLIAGPLGLASGGIALYARSTPVAGSFNPVGAGTYLLQSSISSSQTSITLTSFAEPSSNIPYTMAYINSDIVYGTIAPSSGNSEFISFTGIVQNANGTATLTGITRGEARTPGTGGCVASTTLAHAYPGQTQFILSNSPCFYSEYAVKKNDEKIRGAWTFYSTSTPKYFYNPGSAAWTIAASTTLASKGYVDDQVTSGCANANTTTRGCVEIATALEAASSTQTGGTGAIIVYGNGMATDTPTQNAASASKIAMTDLTGFLRQTWLDLTKQWNFTAAYITSASSTNATTTSRFALPYITSSFLKTDSVGAVVAATAGTDYNYTLSSSGTVLSSSGTGTSTLTIAIPANTLSAGRSLDIKVPVSCTGGSSRMNFGVDYGTGIASTTLTGFSMAGSCATAPVVIADIFLIANTSALETMATYIGGSNLVNTSATAGTTTAYSITNQSYIAVRYNVLNGSDTATVQGYTVQVR